MYMGFIYIYLLYNKLNITLNKCSKSQCSVMIILTIIQQRPIVKKHDIRMKVNIKRFYFLIFFCRWYCWFVVLLCQYFYFSLIITNSKNMFIKIVWHCKRLGELATVYLQKGQLDTQNQLHFHAATPAYIGKFLLAAAASSKVTSRIALHNNVSIIDQYQMWSKLDWRYKPQNLALQKKLFNSWFGRICKENLTKCITVNRSS